MKKRLTSLLIPFLLIGGIIATGVYANKIDTLGNKTDNQSFEANNVSALEKWDPEGTIVALTENGVLYYSVEDEKSSSYKINNKYVSGYISNDGSLLYIEQGVTIWQMGKNIDSKGTVDVSAGDIATISPDNNQVAYISFLNSEKEYGYNVFILDKNNNASSIFSTTSQVRFLSWLDNENIILVTDNSKNNITKIDIKTKKTTGIFTTDETINNIYCTNGSIVLSTNTNKNNVSIIDQDNKVNTIDTTIESRSLTISPDLTTLAYINSNNEIELQDLNKGNHKIIGSAIKLLGWYK